MATWVDFKELRQKLDFAGVLTHYGVELKLKGNQHHGFCPLPTHDGQKRSPSFSANMERRIWQCFGCGAKGNVIDFACRMEGLNPEKGEDLRKAALILQDRYFEGDRPPSPLPPVNATAPSKAAEPTSPSAGSVVVEPTPKGPPPKSPGPTAPRAGAPVINAPLDFELKGLDPKHPYLAGRAFTADTIAHFSLGYASRGFMKGRIAIPLHDPAGKLIGYAGRLVDDAAVNETTPKYRFPSKRDHNGIVYEFHKSAFLYHGHAIPGPIAELIIVEGFPSVWWLWQAGITNVVGLMGASCSETQAKLIVSLVVHGGLVWLMPDGDAAGERCAESLLLRIAPYRFTRWLKLEHGKQPTDYASCALGALFGEDKSEAA